MTGFLTAPGKQGVCAALLTLLLLPIPATADSELPTGVDPRPSGPDLEQLIAVLRTAPENGWVRVNSNQFQETGTLI